MKKSLRWSLGFLVVAVSLALVLPGEVASAKTTTTKPKKAEKHTPAYWTVSATDATANTIDLQKSDSSSNLTLKVTAATKITVENKPGKLADLQKGQKVNFTASGDTCSSIEAVAAPADNKKKK